MTAHLASCRTLSGPQRHIGSDNHLCPAIMYMQSPLGSVLDARSRRMLPSAEEVEREGDAQ